MTTSKTTKKTVYLLAGDIGGTNSRLCLYDDQTGTSSSRPLASFEFKNAEYIPEEQHGDVTVFQRCIITPFLEQHCWGAKRPADLKLVAIDDDDGVDIRAVLAVAGVVSNNAVRMTNVGGMIVDGHAIAAASSNNKYLRIIRSCTIINDFVAQGYGCLTLQPHEVRHLYGTPDNVLDLAKLSGPKVCVGAGTGLGECYLTTAPPAPPAVSHNDVPPLPLAYTCFPSEGGHVDYAPRTELEVKMLRYMSQKFGGTSEMSHRISVERVVSGVGLANVYEFLATEFPNQIDQKIHDELNTAGDEKGRVVATYVATNELCRRAMQIMMAAYGSEVGSAAIKWIPTGGLFVTGGLTPKNIDHIAKLDGDFMQSYQNKGRVAPLLATIPLFAVLVEDLGVRGAHQVALREYEQHEQQKSSVTTRNGHCSTHMNMPVQCWAGVAVAVVASFGLGAMLGRRQQS
jgi:glucokinase